MKLMLLILLLPILSYSTEQEIILSATDGRIYYSDSTEAGVEYIITVEGSYSMWPQYNDQNNIGCIGADACYIYDVPKEEMDAFRWPPDSINIPLVGKQPFVPLPQYVGDDTEYSLPPKEIAIPSILISFRKNTGFRINGEPLPKYPIDRVTHRYQISKIGDGNPFEFQILDSAFNILQEKTIARYEDNCGSLKIIVKKVEEEGVTICDVEPICEDGVYIGLKLNASVYEKDTSLIGGRRNLLHDLDYNQIAVVDNGRFICDIDSIDCTVEAGSNAAGILIDVSGSMAAAITEGGSVSRIGASKNAIIGFIDQLRNIDSSFIQTFSTEITLKQDWTNDKIRLKNVIESLEPSGATQFYNSVLEGVRKIRLNQSPNRYLIVLSDGANTVEPNWSEDYLDTLRKINIPVYFIALGFNDSEQEIIARHHMQLMADATNGKVFDVRDEDELNKVYQDIFFAKKLSDCCSIYFPIDPCLEGEDRTIRLLFAPKGTNLYSEYLTFNCINCEDIVSGGIIKEGIDESEENIKLFPNPNDGLFNLSFNTNNGSNVIINLYNYNGKFIQNLFNNYATSNVFNEKYNFNELNSGMYIIQIKLNGIIYNKKFIINN